MPSNATVAVEPSSSVMVAVPTVWMETLMSWLALALYSPSLLPTLVCWIVVPALIAAGITPTMRTKANYTIVA